MEINWSNELLSLCVKYHQMFDMEQEAKRATIEQTRIWYTEAYQVQKEFFDEQLQKVESLLQEAFEAGGDCFVDGGEIIRKHPYFEKWFNNTK